MDFSQIASQFHELKAQYDAGTLSEADFKARLQDLMVQDEQGRWWMIGYETGQWYVHDGEKWIRGEPRALQGQPATKAAPPPEKPVVTEAKRAERAAPPPAPAPRSRLPLIAGVIAAAVLIAVTAFLAGRGQPPAATPTPTERPTLPRIERTTPIPPTQDTVQIVSISPAPDMTLKSNQTTTFRFKLHYTLVSRDEALVFISIAQFDDTPSKCNAQAGELVVSNSVAIKRGEGDAELEVTWLVGDTGKGGSSPAGYAAPAPSLWEADKGDRISYLGVFTDFCYFFAP